jgi:hypothetical protein
MMALAELPIFDSTHCNDCIYFIICLFVCFRLVENARKIIESDAAQREMDLESQFVFNGKK